MGNGTSIGQGSHTTYGRRDDGESAKYSNWPELSGAKLAESSELGRVHHMHTVRFELSTVVVKVDTKVINAINQCLLCVMRTR